MKRLLVISLMLAMAAVIVSGCVTPRQEFAVDLGGESENVILVTISNPEDKPFEFEAMVELTALPVDKEETLYWSELFDHCSSGIEVEYLDQSPPDRPTMRITGTVPAKGESYIHLYFLAEDFARGKEGVIEYSIVLYSPWRMEGKELKGSLPVNATKD